ncbi:MAG: TolC family protein [bacterium]|nr:TolC family protein [bacterium]
MDRYKTVVVWLIIIFLSVLPAGAQKKAKADKKPARGSAVSVELSEDAAVVLAGQEFTLGEAIKFALDRNHEILAGKYDVAMADSLYRKFQKKYSIFLQGDVGAKYQEFPGDMSSVSGTDTRGVDASASIAKMFSTGTTVAAGIKHEYAKTSYVPIDLSAIGIPEPIVFGDPNYHRPVLFVSIQQELLKNMFGYSERRQEQILKNAATMQRDYILFMLSGVVVNVIVDYWTLVVQKSALENATLQLKETRIVRNIIAQNVRLGLAERYMLNSYNSMVAAAEASKKIARQNYKDSLRIFLRTTNMDEKVTVSGITVLSNKLPKIDRNAAIKAAYTKRADYQNAILNLENSRLGLEISENGALPSLKAELNASSMAQRDGVGDAYGDMGTMTSPSIEVRMKVTYPLNDHEQKINERNARYKLKQAKIELEKYKRLTRDDVIQSIEHIETYYGLYNDIRRARIQAELSYRRMLTSLRRGRSSVTFVKNALDGLVETRQQELGSLVQYNVKLLMFQVSKNELFEYYKIDVDKYIPKD